MRKVHSWSSKSVVLTKIITFEFFHLGPLKELGVKPTERDSESHSGCKQSTRLLTLLVKITKYSFLFEVNLFCIIILKIFSLKYS